MKASISTHPRKDGTTAYRVRFRLVKGGNPVSETFDTYQDALNFQQLVQQVGGKEARKIRDVVTNQPDSLTLAQAFEQYCEHVATYATPRTVADYKRLAERYWLSDLGSYPIGAIDRERIVAWVGKMRNTLSKYGTPLSSKTIRNIHGLLSAVFDLQLQRGTIDKNPAKGVRIHSDRARREMAFLSPTQFRQLYQAIKSDKWRDFVLLLYVTGLRWSEATALTPADFDFTSTPATITVSKAWKADEHRHPYIGAPKTKAGYRTISLPESAASILRERVENIHDGDLVFSSYGDPRRPPSPSNFHKTVWKKAIRDSGLTVKPRVHDLRHSHVAALIEQGVPLPVIQRRLGHESITTTVDRYGHLTDAALARAADAMGAALGL